MAEGYHLSRYIAVSLVISLLDFRAEQDKKSLEGLQQMCDTVWFVTLIESVSGLKIAQRRLGQKESVVKFKDRSEEKRVETSVFQVTGNRSGILYIKVFVFLIFKIIATVLIFWTTFFFNSLNSNYRTLISVGNPLGNKKFHFSLEIDLSYMRNSE